MPLWLILGKKQYYSNFNVSDTATLTDQTDFFQLLQNSHFRIA